MKISKFKKFSIIYFEDKLSDEIFILRSGQVLLKIRGLSYFDNNRFTKMRTINPGDVFGFEDVFYGIRRSERAIAIEDSELITFKRDEFAGVIRKNINSGVKIINSLCKVIADFNEKILELTDLTKNADDDSKSSVGDIFFYYMNIGNKEMAKEVLERIREIPGCHGFYEKHKDKV